MTATARRDSVETRLTVNGRRQSVDHDPAATLLSVIRDDLGLKGSKPGCGKGECGACTVLVDGRPRMSCITLVALVPGSAVETIEGLAETTAPLRAAFAEHGAFQCGYCTPGQVVSAHAAATTAAAGREGLRAVMSGNICRCTGYTPIITAIEAASE